MSFVRDIAWLAGGGLVLYGLWQLCPPIAYVAAGVGVMAGAVVWSLNIGRNRNDP